MVDHNRNIDELIRSKFEAYEPEPPESVWASVQRQIGTPPPASPIISVIIPVVTGIALMIALILLFNSYQTVVSSAQADQNHINNPVERSGSWLATINQPAEEAYAIHSEVYISSSEITGGVSGTSLENRIPVRAPFERSVNVPAAKPADGSPTALAARRQVKTPKSYPDRFTANSRMSALEIHEVLPDERNSSLLSKYSGTSDEAEYLTSRRPGWSLGIYMNPETSFYPNDNLPNSMNISVSLLPEISFNRLFLQGGLNLRIATDQGNYQVDYIRYLGQYEDVYLVTFDSTENGVIPTYHTQTTDVYDTVDHYSVTKTKARYTYLEIPVFIGFKQTYGKFSWFVKGGPSLSLLAARHIPEAELPDEPLRVVNVDRQVPLRSSMNWQLMFSAGVDYRLTPHFSFALEPTLRYFLSPEFSREQLQTKHPYAVGLRAGLIYHFKD